MSFIEDDRHPAEEVQYKGTLSSENMSSGIKGGAGVAALTLQSPCLAMPLQGQSLLIHMALKHLKA